MSDEWALQTAIDRFNRAVELAQSGDIDGAIELAKRARSLVVHLLGQEHPDHSSILNFIAHLFELKGDHRSSEPFRRQAAEVSRRVEGENHPEYASTLVNLGNALRMCGDLEQAATLLDRALEIYRDSIGEMNGSYASALNTRALIDHHRGDFAAAEKMYRRAAELMQAIEVDGGSDRSSVLGNLASLLTSRGEYTSAAELWKQVREIDRATLGEDDPGYASNLRNMATLHQMTGEFETAEALDREALHILTAALGEAHPETLATMNNLANVLVLSGKHDEAEPLLVRVCQGLGEIFGRDHPDYATALANLASAYQTQGRYGDAEPLFREAVRIHAARSAKTPEYLVSLNNLAHFYHVKGDYGSAEPLYRQALQLRREIFGEEHTSYITGLNNLASLFEARGDLESSELLFMQALDTYHRLLDDPNSDDLHPNYASLLNNFAHLKEMMGKYDEAEGYYREALRIRRTVLAPTHFETTSSLNNLATMYLSRGRYAEAFQLYEEARESFSDSLGHDHPRYAAVLGNLAVLHFNLGDYEKSRELFERSLEIRRAALSEAHLDVISNMSSLAGLYAQQGRYNEAESLHVRAYEAVLNSLGEEHSLLASCLNNLAMLYEKMGRYAEEEPLLQRALKINLAVLGEDHPLCGIAMNNIANLDLFMGNYDSAERLARQALRILGAVWGEMHPHYAESLSTLAGVAVATGAPLEGLRLMREIAAVRDRTVGQIFAIGSERQRMAFLEDNRGDLEGLLSLVLRHLPDSPDAANWAFDMVLRRKALGAEALAAQRDAVFSGKYPALAPKLKALNLLRREIARKMSSGPGLGGLEAFRAQLADWDAQKERMESDLAREIPEMSLERKLLASDRIAVARELPPGSALVEFVRFDVFNFCARLVLGEARWDPARYLAFILKGTEAQKVHMIDLGEASRIDRMIGEFRDEIILTADQHRDDSAGATQRDIKISHRLETKTPSANLIGSALRAAVFDPLASAIGDCTRLLIAPDGSLTRLPFEVLPVDDGRLLTDRFDISYLACGRDILRFHNASTGRATEPLVAADPDFNYGGSAIAVRASEPSLTRSPRGLEQFKFPIERLPATEVEGRNIAKRLGVRPWLGSDVLEGRFKEKCVSPLILHLATHGYFLEDEEGASRPRRAGIGDPVAFGEEGTSLIPSSENPLLRAGLMMAGVNTWYATRQPVGEAEDGLLTAEDVSGLDLLATELVVLSACDTGLGRVVTGEGVFGLQRAFILAGAKSLVISLWPVPDLTTALLMDRFYELLIDQRRGRSEALKGAQAFVRTVTVGEIRGQWLSAEMITRLSRGNPEVESWYWNLAKREEHCCPFTTSYFWGAFVCIGNPYTLSSHYKH